jgi:hypothetical protein
MDLIDKIIIVKGGLARQDVLAVVINQCLVQLLGLGRGVGVDQLIKCEDWRKEEEGNEEIFHRL